MIPVAFATALLLGWQGAAPPDRPAVPPARLDIGVPATFAPGPADRRTFELAVHDPAVLRIAIDQEGADVVATVALPGAAPVVLDTPTRGRIGREWTVLHAAAAGTATLTLETRRIVGAGARVRVRVDALPAVDGLVAAVAALAEASELPDPREPSLAEARAAALVHTLPVWRELGDPEAIAVALVRLGRLQLSRLQRPADAERTFADAVAALAAASGTASDLAVTLVEARLEVARAQRQLGQAREALATLDRVQSQISSVDTHLRAVIESDTAQVLIDQGSTARGLAHARRAAEAFRAEGALRDVIATLERIAHAHGNLRQLDEAFAAVADAQALMPAHGTPRDELTLARTLGSLHTAAGDGEAAIAAYRRAAALAPPNSLEALILELDVARQLNSIGEFAAARDILERVVARIPAQEQNAWAAAATELGYSLTRLGEPARALPLQQKAHAFVKAAGSPRAEIIALRDLASTQRALGDLAGAEATVARMAELAGSLPSTFAPWVSLAQSRNARLAGDLDRARTLADRAIAEIDSARANVRAAALRTAFAGNTQGYYNEAIDLAMAMHAAAPSAGHDARALTLFERSRARSLAELLAGARIDIQAGLDAAHLAQQQALHQQFARADAAIRAAGTGEEAKGRVAALEAEIDGVLRELAILDARARDSNPRYRAATRPALGSLAEIQALLDEDTVLIAYALAPTHGWAWAVTTTGVRAFPVPVAAVVDAAARKVVAAVRTPARGDAGRAAALASDMAALSDLVLGPIAEPLRTEWRGRRLAIVATGPLEYVPFAALPAPGSGASAAGTPAGTMTRLVDDHEIVVLPSATVLAMLREQQSSRPDATGQLVVVADPVYSADDPRVRVSRLTRREGTPAAVIAARRDTEATPARRTGSELARLVFSRQEARAVASIAGSSLVQALDFDASLETVRGPTVAAARIVHFATHGSAYDHQPERSALIFSLVDRDGRPQDGILRLADVSALSLSADLVVLSGCDTGLGRQMRGEGLVGLTRAFMHAGAPRIVSSLWRVDDRATAELMTRFYRHLLHGGARPAAALRQAQAELARDRRWADPYYWAGFVLHGDWR